MNRIVAPMAALVSLMMAFDAQAQDGLRSASLPERPVATTPPPAHNPYTATADTYTKLRPVFPPIGLPIIGYDGVYVDDVWRRPVPQTRRREEPRMRERDVVGTSYVPARVPVPPAAKGRPKTFYVIPGCYAGDTRPLPTSAPSCDLSQLRVIPPR